MKLEPVKPGERMELRDKDASAPKSLPKGDELKEKLEKLLEELGELQSVFNASAKHSLLIILQGRDASGKDGVVRTVVGG